MGSWGSGPFENDSASDWVHELKAVTDDSVVRSALALGDDEYLDNHEGSSAWAAAEVVAAALGRPHLDLPQEVQHWVELNGSTVKKRRKKAGKALERILAHDSELHDMWDEAGALEEFSAQVLDCADRLRRA